MKYSSLILLSCAVLTALVSAQTQSLNGPMRLTIPAARPPLKLATQPDVQRELKLTPSQERQAAAVLPSGQPAPDQYDALYTRLKSLLTPVQTSRLEQIHRQKSGLYAATYPPYAKALGLTEAQIRQILAVYSQLMSDAMKEQMAQVQHRPATDGPVQLGVKPGDEAKMKASLAEKCRTVLTAAQWAKWRSMLGKPFAAKAGGQ